jgi:putative oxidoreductase
MARGHLLGPRPTSSGSIAAIELIRIVAALLVLAHGAYRAASGGYVPFGQWLEGQGFPYGLGWALLVTGIELIGPVAILLRRYVLPFSLLHMIILSLGLWLVHRPEGWFVVGAGRNGMEYSVLLIACFAAVAWAYRPRGRR